jgi:hypothetical protein
MAECFVWIEDGFGRDRNFVSGRGYHFQGWAYCAWARVWGSVGVKIEVRKVIGTFGQFEHASGDPE